MVLRQILVAWILLLLPFVVVAADERSEFSVPCPFDYPRHSLDDIIANKSTPYLFGGIYKRPCINCQRGALWSTWCGWTNTTLPFYDMQLCTAAVTRAVIAEAAERKSDGAALTMTPCDMWYYMRGRTTWIIGDSMSKDLFKALRCFMVEFHDLHTYHASSNFTIMHHMHSIPGYGEPRCIHMPDHTRLCQLHVIQGDLFVNSTRIPRGVLPMLLDIASPQDLLVINFGLWHGTTQAEAYRQHLHEVGAWFNSTRKRFPNVFWMQTPKQHFDSNDGDFKDEWLGKRSGPWTCQPIHNVLLNKAGALETASNETDPVAAFVVDGTWRNLMAADILGKQYKMPIIPVYNVTVPAWDKHRHNLAGQECSHYCHPGVPQLWVYSLMTTWHKHYVRDIQDPEKQKPRDRPCTIAWERQEKELGLPMSLDKARLKVQYLQQHKHHRHQHGQSQHERGAVPAAAAAAEVGSNQLPGMATWLLASVAAVVALMVLLGARHQQQPPSSAAAHTTSNSSSSNDNRSSSSSCSLLVRTGSGRMPARSLSGHHLVKSHHQQQ